MSEKFQVKFKMCHSKWYCKIIKTSVFLYAFGSGYIGTEIGHFFGVNPTL